MKSFPSEKYLQHLETAFKCVVYCRICPENSRPFSVTAWYSSCPFASMKKLLTKNGH